MPTGAVIAWNSDPKPATRSPSTIAMWQKLSSTYPNAKWYEYEALSDDNAREATKLAFGKVYQALLDFKAADVVVSFVLIQCVRRTRR